ncbi:lysine--tRNA ligase [bacterium]|nr:lysine--tRNA ligase [bacterium]
MAKENRKETPIIDENEVIKRKKEKIVQLKELGVNAYANGVAPDTTTEKVIALYKDEPLEALKTPGGREKHSIAGRVVALRVMGKLAFARIKDEAGSLQVAFTRDTMGEDFYKLFKKSCDIGDIIWVEGEVFVTRTEELTLLVDKFTLLTKSIRPLPEKFHGLTDKELRYRQRYLDLIMNDEVKKSFVTRTKIVKFIRNFMDEHDFLEVETPMLHPLVSGAAAKPFETHHNALDMKLVLRIAPELHLKRLLVGGMGKVYEINRNFRNEGISVKHNPEFTMMEFYWPYATYEDMMLFTEKMIAKLAEEITGSTQVVYQEKTIDFSAPWKRMTVEESLIEAGVVTKDALKDESALKEIAKTKGISADKIEKMSRFKVMMELFDEVVEPTLWNPTFITKYPSEVSPLARRSEDDDDYTDRYELFMAGREIANAFSELNDPAVQLAVFQQQAEAKQGGDEEAFDMDVDYIRALEYAMPPAAGQGIGIDRLVMLLVDAPSIRDVILFPHMRPE